MSVHPDQQLPGQGPLIQKGLIGEPAGQGCHLQVHGSGHPHGLRGDGQKQQAGFFEFQEAPQVQSADGSQGGDTGVDDQLGVEFGHDPVCRAGGHHKTEHPGDLTDCAVSGPVQVSQEDLPAGGHLHESGFVKGGTESDHTAHNPVHPHDPGQLFLHDAVLHGHHPAGGFEQGKDLPCYLFSLMGFGGDQYRIHRVRDLVHTGHSRDPDPPVTTMTEKMYPLAGNFPGQPGIPAYQGHLQSLLLHQCCGESAHSTGPDHQYSGMSIHPFSLQWASGSGRYENQTSCQSGRGYSWAWTKEEVRSGQKIPHPGSPFPWRCHNPLPRIP